MTARPEIALAQSDSAEYEFDGADETSEEGEYAPTDELAMESGDEYSDEYSEEMTGTDGPTSPRGESPFSLVGMSSELKNAVQGEGDAACGTEAGCGEELISCSSCCRCPPTWVVRGAWLYFQRDRPRPIRYVNIARGGVAGIAESFNSEAFSFQYEPGVELSSMLKLDNGLALESRSFALWDVDDRARTGPFTPGQVVFNSNPLTVINNLQTTFVNGTYDADLYSSELNLWTEIESWFRVGTGVRYIYLRETMTVDLDFANGGDLAISHQTRNNLYGLQESAEVDLFKTQNGFFRCSGLFKGGVYASEGRHLVNTAAFLPVAPGTLTASGSRTNTEIAFVGEVGLNLTVKLTENLSITGGYQVLFMDGLALASDQIPVTGNIFGNPAVAGRPIATDVDLEGSVFYHGLSTGLELKY